MNENTHGNSLFDAKMEATNSLFSLFDATNSMFDAKMEATNSLFDAANSLFDAKMEATNSLFDAVEFFNSSQILCQCLFIIKNHKNQLLRYLNYLYIFTQQTIDRISISLLWSTFII